MSNRHPPPRISQSSRLLGIVSPMTMSGLLCVVSLLASSCVSREASAKVGVGRRAGLKGPWASYYSDTLAGRRTASGERYNPAALTCAHRRLPFGTVLRITVRDTGAHATCRVNDRGPFVRGRVVDVSRVVARALGALKRGVVPVRLEVVSRPR